MADDKDEYLAYAAHCEQMADSADNETDKALWLRMAAAWRREGVRPRHTATDPTTA